MKTLLIALIIILGAAGFYVTQNKNSITDDAGSVPAVTVVDFTTCVAAGNAVMESYPRQCRSAEGELYVENIGNELEKADLIRIDTPRPNTVVRSPLAISGEARGYWFFEATFPVVVTDWDGVIIGEGYATADLSDGGTWMTENFVPFTGEVVFTVPADTPYKRGTLILKRDNASGLPEHDDALEIPVVFE